MSLRDKYLEIASRPPRMEPVKFCGDDLFVREMGGADFVAFSIAQAEANRSGDAKHTLSARMVVFSLCDADGNRVFRDDDVERVIAMPGHLLAEPFAAAVRLNGMAEDQEQQRGKNSETPS